MTVAQQHPGEEEAEKLGPWIMWRLWKNRNDLVIKGVEYDAMELVMKAKEDKEEWENREEVKKKREAQTLTENHNEKWHKPPFGWLKCNVDGSWNKQNELCGIGWAL